MSFNAIRENKILAKISESSYISCDIHPSMMSLIVLFLHKLSV